VSATLPLSADTRGTAGILLLTIVFIEYGGTFVLRLVRGSVPATEFQRSFARAGHAHAGVLVSLALLGLVLADGASMSGLLRVLARNGIWVAAILLPAGFFFSSAGRGRTTPNGFIALVYAGALSLAAGVVSLGIALLTT
jgi:hypothetical protein